jgi:hypothetical protein
MPLFIAQIRDLVQTETANISIICNSTAYKFTERWAILASYVDSHLAYLG